MNRSISPFYRSGRNWNTALLLAILLSIGWTTAAPAQTRSFLKEQSRLYHGAVKQVFSRKYAEALRSLEAFERNGFVGADDPELGRATILDLKSKALNGLDRHGEALAHVRAALAILERRRPPEHLEILLARENLAFALSGLERYDEAAVEAERMVLGYSRAYGPNSPPVIYSLNLLSTKRVEQSRFTEAAQVSARSMLTCEKTPSAENGFCFSALLQHGFVRLRQGEYRAAANLLERSVEIAQKTAGKDPKRDPLKLAEALIFLGSAYSSQGRREDALAVTRRGVALRERIAGPNSRQLASGLIDLALVEVNVQDLAAAERSSRRALSILDGLPDTLARLRSAALAQLATVLVLQKRMPEADQILARAIPMADLVMGPQNSPVSSAYFELARLRQEQGRYRESAQLFAHIESAMLRIQGADHPDFVFHHVGVGNLAARQSQWDGALASYRRARDVSLRNRANWSDLEDRIDASASEEFSPFARVAITAARLAQDRPGQRRALSDEALVSAQYLLNSKAGIALANMAARMSSGSDALSEAVRDHQDLSQKLISDEKELIARLSASTTDDHSVSALRSRIRAAKSKVEESTNELERAFPKFTSLTRPKPLAASDIQRLLRPDEGMLVYLPLAQSTLVWAVTREDIVVHSIPISSAKLSETVSGLRKTLDIDALRAAIAAGRPLGEALFDLQAAHDLYSSLIGPVEAVVRGKRHLLVVPSGPLTSLPFHLLVSEQPVRSSEPLSTMRAYREAAWLVRRHAMSVLPSVSSLEALRANPVMSRAVRPLIGFGDPIFGSQRSSVPKGKAGNRSRQPATLTMASLRGGRGIDMKALRQGLPRLPDTADELREVGRQLGASSDDLRLGANATVMTVKSAPLEMFKVVYFATHGLVAGEVSGLAEPALALTVPEQATDEDNGLLTASDVARLHLDAEWVVLSACNTAAGDAVGAEGLSGLARAFFYAGARALLVSHWAVDSETTVKLTTRTFAALAADPEIGRSEALQRSMLALIDDPSSPLNAYPGIWAAFIVAGEGAR